MTPDAQLLDRQDGPIDTRVRIITPERIVFEFPTAGPFPRFCAFLIDQVCLLVLILVAIVSLAILSFGTGVAGGLGFIAYFVLTWGYGAFCEGFFNGRTIGKRMTGLRVVTDQGVPISKLQAVLRNTVGAVDGLLPFWFLPGLTSMVLTRKFQRLGDLAAGTMVVHDEPRSRAAIIRIDEPEVRAILPRLPIRLAAGSQLTRALADYVPHRRRFGPARRAEMAEPLARPLRIFLGLPPDVPADALLCAVYHRITLGE